MPHLTATASRKLASSRPSIDALDDQETKFKPEPRSWAPSGQEQRQWPNLHVPATASSKSSPELRAPTAYTPVITQTDERSLFPHPAGERVVSPLQYVRGHSFGLADKDSPLITPISQRFESTDHSSNWKDQKYPILPGIQTLQSHRGSSPWDERPGMTWSSSSDLQSQLRSLRTDDAAAGGQTPTPQPMDAWIGDADVPSEVLPTRLCSVASCGRSAKRNGMCPLHNADAPPNSPSFEKNTERRKMVAPTPKELRRVMSAIERQLQLEAQRRERRHHREAMREQAERDQAERDQAERERVQQGAMRAENARRHASVTAPPSNPQPVKPAPAAKGKKPAPAAKRKKPAPAAKGKKPAPVAKGKKVSHPGRAKEYVEPVEEDAEWSTHDPLTWTTPPSSPAAASTATYDTATTPAYTDRSVNASTISGDADVVNVTDSMAGTWSATVSMATAGVASTTVDRAAAITAAIMATVGTSTTSTGAVTAALGTVTENVEDNVAVAVRDLVSTVALNVETFGGDVENEDVASFGDGRGGDDEASHVGSTVAQDVEHAGGSNILEPVMSTVVDDSGPSAGAAGATGASNITVQTPANEINPTTPVRRTK
ncbi:hypothetical protein BBJ28_00000494, partial [Nothophytophthora sp. Chile5]